MSIDVIGPLIVPATYDAEGNELTPAKTLPGYHVNVTPDEMTPELEAYRVEPSPLRRVWAGDSRWNPTITVALRFADEAEFRAYFP